MLFGVNSSRIALAASSVILLSTIATAAVASRAGNAPPASVIVGTASSLIATGNVSDGQTRSLNGSAGTASAGRGDGGGGTTAQASVSLAQIVFSSSNALADASAFPSTIYHSSAAAGLTYFLLVNGPENIDVPLLLSGSGSTSAAATHDGGNASSMISFSLSNYNNLTGGTDFAIRNCDVFNTPAQCGSLLFSAAFTLRAYTNAFDGRTAEVDLYSQTRADANNTIGSEASGGANGSIDPVIIIDPNFLIDHPGFSLSFSQGIIPEQAGIPEPATWALMIGGFGLAGATLRRRRAALA